METSLLLGLFFLAAFLYSSVGHAGASGYLTAMILVGVPPAIMKPTSLGLNIFVATIASVQFLRAGYFSWRLYWPFGLGAIPLAFLGGSLTLTTTWYFALVGMMLVLASVGLFCTVKLQVERRTNPPPILVGVLIGSLIGLLSGLTGTGGGIFLSPVILFFGWASTRVSSGIAAVFILGNSVAGLSGQLAAEQSLPAEFPIWAIAVVSGGWLGSYYGSRRFGVTTFRRLLAFVLLIAAGKFIAKSCGLAM